MIKPPLLIPMRTRTNNEFKAKRAHDSMNMVTIALHNPPLPLPPMALRMLLACRRSRMTIITVRMTLSEREIDKYGTPDHSLVVSSVVW